ncbi:MAG: 1-deoxy-D-xylulose-5-phosphate reductoisomerase [Candidatus Omnitrophica bacterium]|nr:1-deoxy-D-xylulose-5-phosphate reductoisomerase [Candidatus Omnitrophota bacterium]
MKRITILGSTGSIGVNALKVISNFPDRFKVVGLSAHKNTKLLAKQVREYRPKFAAIGEREGLPQLKRDLSGCRVKTLCGQEGLAELASCHEADLVVVALSGDAGLLPTVAALKASKDIALANKESLVSAGSLITRLARKKGARIIPIDSEHSAIFQCMAGRDHSELKRIFLTGTGGPMLKSTKARMKAATPKVILKHPKWKMGPKVTVDSATLMNKGFEVIEAHWLFGIDMERIEVLIHPEAIIHSMVELRDGAILAQLSEPDMRLPIQYALSFPERLNGKYTSAVDFARLGSLHFEHPDLKKFPCLDLVRQAMAKGGTYPATLSASNEELVRAFLKGCIGFIEIPSILKKVLKNHRSVSGDIDLEDVLNAHIWARAETQHLINKKRR